MYIVSIAPGLVNDLSQERVEDGAEIDISINPITNLVSMTIAIPPADEDDVWGELGQAFAEALVQAIGPGYLERELNVASRQRYDFYAMLIPYSVKIELGEASPEAIARAKERRAAEQAEQERQRGQAQQEQQRIVAQRERQREQAQRKAERERRDYINSFVVLENVRVAKGERFGRPVDAVFGTVANNGDRTLNLVRIVVFYLGENGNRIGEVSYTLVLVSDFSLSDDPPLRPGYRKDFGYNLENDAPTDWSKQVEVEIAKIKFVEEEG